MKRIQLREIKKLYKELRENSNAWKEVKEDIAKRCVFWLGLYLTILRKITEEFNGYNTKRDIRDNKYLLVYNKNPWEYRNETGTQETISIMGKEDKVGIYMNICRTKTKGTKQVAIIKNSKTVDVYETTTCLNLK